MFSGANGVHLHHHRHLVTDPALRQAASDGITQMEGNTTIFSGAREQQEWLGARAEGHFVAFFLSHRGIDVRSPAWHKRMASTCGMRHDNRDNDGGSPLGR